MKSRLKQLFPKFLTAYRNLSRFRKPFYHPIAFPFASPPALLKDLPSDQTNEINQHSDEYFNQPELNDYWKNKPLSDLENGPQYLWRLGLLLSACNIRPEDRVLDFGCGTGWTSVMMAKIGAEIVGMDISANALELARNSAAATLSPREQHRIRFQLFSGETIEAPDESFDFVIIFDAFHHLPNPASILREFYRVLAPHGILGFAEPGIGHSHSDTAMHETGHGILEEEVDPEQLYRSALKAGFLDLELLVPALPANVMTLPMKRARWYLRGISWLVPQNFMRAAILSAPIGILRKGPYLFNSLHPNSLLASIKPETATIHARAGESFELTAVVINPTTTVWLKEGRKGLGYVRLGAHLMNSERTIIDHDYGRSELPYDLSMNRSAKISLKLKAPENRGNYFVRLDMVDEGIAWFEQKGSRTVDVQLIVQ